MLHDALAATPNNKQLWEAAIFHEEAEAAPDMAAVVLELCERASAPPGTAAAEEGKPVAQLSERDREEFCVKVSRPSEEAQVVGGPPVAMGRSWGGTEVHEGLLQSPGP